MIRNFRYIIDGKLAGMGHPGLSGELEHSLLELKTLGIGALVSLDEFGLDEAVLRRQELAYLHLPIDDFSTPTLQQADQFVDFVRAQLAEGTAVACHCYAGIGRTGTMLACYLAAEGVAASEAVRRVRSGAVPAIETAEQELFVDHYARHARSRQARRQGD